MKLLKWAIIVALGVAVQTVATAYYVGTKMTYKFMGFNGLLNSINNGQPITTIIQVNNPTIFNMKIKNLQIEVVDRSGLQVLSFLPVNAVFRAGLNELPLTFDKGDLGNLLGDYISGTYKQYKIKIKGRLGGFLPFKYTYSLDAQ